MQWTETTDYAAQASIAQDSGKQIVATMGSVVDIPWKAPCTVSGKVAVCFDNGVALNPQKPDSAHTTWFVGIQKVFADCQQHTITDTSGYEINGSNVIAWSAGVCKGSQGTATSVQVTQTPLAGAADGAASEAQTYVIPLDEDGMPAVEPLLVTLG